MRMPIWFRIEGSQRLLLAHAEGVLTVSEIEDVVRRAAQHPDFGPGFHQLCDLRELQKVCGSYSEFAGLREYVGKFSDRLEGGRLALVAHRDSIYGMLRMYQAILDDQPIDIHVFREIDEARRWLTDDALGDT